MTDAGSHSEPHTRARAAVLAALTPADNKHMAQCDLIVSLQAICASYLCNTHPSSALFYSGGQTQGRHDAAGVERPQVHHGLKERLNSI